MYRRFLGRFFAPRQLLLHCSNMLHPCNDAKPGIHHIHVNKGRFKSQALLDERALLTCMAYVDLNPIRAGMAKTLETSDYTAVQARIQKTRGQASQLPLVPFEDEFETDQTALPYYLRHYLELVD